ncbi:MAG: ubiquinol-cytochrome C chaperone family protein [Erythrobacter sp.]|uniref:ubiquinol-cytochrome C chaperone family protein n=1 Tax=Qipengyuania citrea TaxID=225971 RepID=UPI001A5B8BAB|nr:ubiquinol-cytochrome C chaperone family protein [Erythrobacter sp.]MCP2018795.1 cytochrome b pre-mRNA-processing protein 3 [Qipengyuania citrea]MDE0902867.1 ubiquinol-cytochrome C chaperone family protein [Erythrobacter sp.]
MSILARLFGTVFSSGPDPREEWRPLWHRVVAEARDPDWYRMCGVADSVEGRYDMITLVLTLVMLRLEDAGDMGPATARLTELFVEDMEGQMREAGIGDPTVGKKINALMESMNGRIGAYRDGLRSDPKVLVEAVRRNVTMAQPDEAEALVQRMAALHARLERTGVDELRTGEIAA